MTNNKINKILFLVHLPPPVHGASMMNKYLVESKEIRDKYEVNVIRMKFVDSITEIGKFSFKKIALFFTVWIKLIRTLVLKKVDLVYLPFSPFGIAFIRDVFYILTVKLFGIKILIHLHVKGISEVSEKYRLKRILYKFVFNGTEIISLTKTLSKDIEGVSKKVPYIVPNGIPVFYVPEKKVKNEDRIPRILYLSNYKKTKGIIDLINALKILKEKKISFLAQMVGSPADLSLNEIQQIVEKNGLNEYIKIIGPLYGNDKIDIYLNSDIFVFPTYYEKETFGLVNLEAMQFGLPVISTTEGGIPDIVQNNITGFIIPPKRPDILAGKMKLLIQNKSMREKMGAKGREMFYKYYTIKHFEKNMLKVIDNILVK